ncbi:TATA element modulatory factor 1 [Physocladia obscura]|uniref:TATA element modulatory factor 1 n=1 Tax=Physocladia obscura TaxID=109957 RepID=A0AAD5T5W9_9FUNG|nr:TATA element modulatory factor 1 [Physocladia obscura]
MDGWFSNITTSLAHVVSEASAHLDQALLDSNSNSTSVSLTPGITIVSASELLKSKVETSLSSVAKGETPKGEDTDKTTQEQKGETPNIGKAKQTEKTDGEDALLVGGLKFFSSVASTTRDLNATLQKNLTLDSLNSFGSSTGDFFSGIISSASTPSNSLNSTNQQVIINDKSDSLGKDKNSLPPPPSLVLSSIIASNSSSHLELGAELLSNVSPSSTQILSNAIDSKPPSEIIESTRKSSEATRLQSEEVSNPIALSNIEECTSSTVLTEEQRLASVISQREQQLVSAMSANALLSDDIADLKKQIDALSATAPNNSTSSLATLEEFARRLDASEKSTNSAIRDRDKYKANLAFLQSSFDETLRQLGEREEKIKNLFEEGEKLSKNELKMSTIVKKLRIKEADSESQIKDQSKKIENLTLELNELKEKLSGLTENEKKLGESLRISSDGSEKQAKQVAKLENELTAAKGEVSSLKAQLERARVDLQELKKLEADVKSVAHAEALEAEILANEALHKQMLDQQKQFANLQAALQKQAFDLQSALTRVENEANWKEDNLRKEIGQLQSRLQAAEERHEDIFAEARAADRPLVRQIESLQVQHAAARKDWEHIEINLTTRLQQAERESLEFAEREISHSQRYEDLNRRFQTLEYQFLRERQESSKIQAELEEKVTKLDNADRSVSDLTAKLVVLKNSHTRALDDAESKFQSALQKAIDEERRKLENAFREERDRIIRERSKVDDIRLLSDKTVGAGSAITISSSLGSGINGNGPVGYGPMRVNSFSSMDGIMSPGGFDTESNRGVSFELGVTSAHGQQNIVVERLYRSLKQLQGQVSSLQTQLQMVTRTRDELAEELVKVTSEVMEAKASASTIDSLNNQLNELNQRYMAALELLGEKTEQVEDLQMNISELRRIQKEEIEELIKLKK